MMLMSSLKEATVQELAELSGRSAQSLYPHLEALVAVGFLIMREPSETGKRSRLYACGPVCGISPIDFTSGSGFQEEANLRALILGDGCARLKRHGLLMEGTPLPGPSARVDRFHSELTWLDDEARARLDHHIAAILDIMREGRKGRAGRRTNVFLAHFPDVTLREARKRNPS